MFTVAQCLDKAMELERRAAQDLPPAASVEYHQMALQWRRLAVRAEIQNRRIAAAMSTDQA